MRRRRLVGALLVAVACGGRAPDPPVPPAPPVPADYEARIESWRAERLEGLRRPDGWLSLAGLHWLEEGASTLGADPASDLLLPEGKAAERVGVLHRTGLEVRFEADPGAAVSLDGEPVTSARLASDADGEPTVLAHRGLTLHVIQRGGWLGLRVKDLESGRPEALAALEHYPIDPLWRIEAVFEPYAEVRMIPVPDITGQIIERPVHGRIVFQRYGAEHALEPLGPPDGELFVVFGDETNGVGTYGGGRFLYVDPPDAEGRLVVDFNRAYNPPCVFTPYATCPLPPRGNRLRLAVEAGERGFAGDHPEAG